MPSLNTKLATAPNTTANYVLKATTSTTIGNSLIFDNGTNVGIGTTTPAELLEVFAPAIAGTSQQTRLRITQAGSISARANLVSGVISGENPYFAIETRQSASPYSIVERLRIDGNGNVGIGTSSPSGQLDVYATGTDLNTYFSQASAGNNNFTRWTRASGPTLIAGVVRNSNDGNQKANTAFMGTTNAYDYLFYTNDTERMRITSGGELYWNVTGTAGGDIVNGGVLFRNNSNKYVQIITGSTADSPLIYFYKNNGSGGVTLTGSIATTGNNTAYNTTSSDKDLKKNFEDWDENVLDIFKNSNPQLFNFKIEEDGEKKTKGFIAQELYEYFPEAYPINLEEKHLFNPSGMVIYLMKAMKEAALQIQDLKAELDTLKQLVK